MSAILFICVKIPNSTTKRYTSLAIDSVNCFGDSGKCMWHSIQGISSSYERKKSKEIVILLIILITISSFSILVVTLDIDKNGTSVHAWQMAYASHAPISINDNAEFNTSNGVVSGNGAASNPYVIQGYDIDASSMVGISIQNTNSSFIIRDCYIHDGGLSHDGIYLHTVSNGIISNNICSNNSYGIILVLSSSNTVSDNTFNLNTQDGMRLISSSGNTLNGNTCSNNSNGIYVCMNSSDNTLSNNKCISNYYSDGIHLGGSSNNTLRSNTCSYNTFGIYLDYSNNNTVSNNTCGPNNRDGIYLTSSYDITLINNTCSANNNGITLYSSSDNTISNNYCSHNTYGIYLESSSDNALSKNNCSDNGEGIVLWMKSTYNVIAKNEIRNSYGYGVNISYDMGNATSYPRDNNILNNTFVDNNGASSSYDHNHIQALDNGVGNLWNISGTPHGYGNKWSDWASPDSNMDGIVDTPYEIDGIGGAKDWCPLADPSHITEPLVSSSMLALIMVLIGAVLLVIVALLVFRMKEKGAP